METMTENTEIYLAPDDWGLDGPESENIMETVIEQMLDSGADVTLSDCTEGIRRFGVDRFTYIENLGYGRHGRTIADYYSSDTGAYLGSRPRI